MLASSISEFETWLTNLCDEQKYLILQLECGDITYRDCFYLDYIEVENFCVKLYSDDREINFRINKDILYDEVENEYRIGTTLLLSSSL